MARPPIPTAVYVLLVVRRGDRFLLVHERNYDQPWYLPAGRVEPGEDPISAARREALEETGIPVEVTGLLRVEYTPQPDGSLRLRIFLFGHPADETPPKQVPDQESLGAAWVGLDELERYPLRSDVVREVLHHVSKGGPVYPLSILSPEGFRWDHA